MKRLKIVVVLVFTFGSVVVFLGDKRAVNVVSSFSSGPPAGFTGAPDENSCTACHSGDKGMGTFTILSVPQTYTPGQTYQLQVRHVTSNQTRLRWGFEMTAITGAGSGAGIFANLSNTTQVLSENGRSYVVQTLIGSAAGQPNGVTWTFTWIAPATNVGPVMFYAAGNQANNDGTSDGDEIYLAQAATQPSGATPTPTATPTATPTSTPTATPTPSGFESDIAPRPNGDGSLASNDVVQIRRFVVSLDTPSTSTNEYQRADAAPISTSGNGVLDSSDTVQTRRYVAGLDTLRAPGGPTGPITAPEPEKTMLGDIWRYFFGYDISIGEVPAGSDGQVTILVDLSTVEAAAASFTLDFDSAVLRNPIVDMADGTTTLTVNYERAEKGELGILVDSSERLGSIFVTFDVRPGVEDVKTPIGFSDGLARRSVSDAFGESIPARFIDGAVTIR